MYYLLAQVHLLTWLQTTQPANKFTINLQQNINSLWFVLDHVNKKPQAVSFDKLTGKGCILKHKSAKWCTAIIMYSIWQSYSFKASGDFIILCQFQWILLLLDMGALHVRYSIFLLRLWWLSTPPHCCLDTFLKSYLIKQLFWSFELVGDL